MSEPQKLAAKRRYYGVERKTSKPVIIDPITLRDINGSLIDDKCYICNEFQKAFWVLWPVNGEVHTMCSELMTCGACLLDRFEIKPPTSIQWEEEK